MDYSPKSDFVRQLDRDVLEFASRGPDSMDEAGFNDLALREFELLYGADRAYRAYCEKVGLSPENIKDWNEIPSVASFAFRGLLRASLPAGKAEELYFNSRVVELGRKRGRIYPDRGAREVMEEANGLLAKSFLFPDVERMRLLLLLPSPRMAYGMVMASGSENLRRRFGTPESGFLVSFRGVDVKGLVGALRRAEKTGEPLALIGPTQDLMGFFDSCEKEGIRFKLPRGSRVCDSGGYTGRYMERPKEEYFRSCAATLGVGEDHCVNALWICESSTIYFDNVLRNSLLGLNKARCKEIPPWSRTVAVDAREFKRLPKGEVGLLRHYDLTNRSMAFSVQTDKLGFETEDGFEVIGRWNREIGSTEFDLSVSHPGGKAVTRAKNYLMNRQLSKVGKIYSHIG